MKKLEIASEDSSENNKGYQEKKLKPRYGINCHR